MSQSGDGDQAGRSTVGNVLQRSTIPLHDPDLESSIRLVEHCPDCVKFIGTDGQLRFMNAAGARLLEIENPASVEGRQWEDLWPEASRAAVRRALTDAQDGRTARFSGFCPTTTGVPKWWDAAVSPFRGADGTIKWILAISRDVTGHKEFEKQLAVSEQRFRALADNMAQLAWMADGTGHIFWYNRRWFEYTGTTLDEVAGWGWQKVHHPDHVERVVTKISAHFKSGEDWEDTFPLRSANSEYRWFLSRARPIRDDAGRVQLWCGTNTDITDQRHASSRLRQKARLIELSHEAILVWDFQSGIVTWNKGCEELYGFARSEALNKRSHDLLRTRHPMSVEQFEVLLRRNGSWTGGLLHTAKDGTSVWVDSRQELLRVDGRDLVLETDRDITARRQAEDIRGLLIGELNHRVKNTLAIVQSIASQTARTSANLGQFTASFNDRLQSMSAVQNVLTETNWAGADLGKVVQSQIVDPSGEGSIKLAGPPVFLSAQSAMQISLILHELASNARRHGSLSVPGGRVSVAWDRHDDAGAKVQLIWRETGGPTVVAPMSHGFGMTLIDRSGNQPHMTARTSFEPTGLVCTIVADVATALPGPIQYFNPGRPLQVHGDDQLGTRTISVRADAKRVLIIEDEPIIAMDVEDVLVEAGFAIAGPASSINGALEVMASHAFDVALVDGNLLGQRVDVLVLELVRRNKPFAFVTGFAKEDLPKGFENIPVVKKPVERDRLIEVVQALTKT